MVNRDGRHIVGAAGNKGLGDGVGEGVISTRPTGRLGMRQTRPEPVGAGYGRSTSGHGDRTGNERGREMVVLRREIGDVLRDARQRQGRTLREVSSAARVSLGYLSEVERGQKEASSELLASICEALDLPMSLVLREVSDRIAIAEGFAIPDTIPADFVAGLLARGGDWRGGVDAELTPVG